MRIPLLLALLVGCIQLQAQPAICDELQAGFTYTTTPNGTQFSNGTTGTGEQTTWYWTFGDGGTSSEPQPFHTYTANGSYEACLYAITIYFNGGPSPTTCVDTACVMIQIGGGNPCDELEACFIASQTGANTVFFNNCTQPGTNTQYVWTFGDGSNGSNVAPTHIYDQPGTYTVCLTAYWGDCVDEYCTTVIVEGGADPCDELSAGFTWSTTPNGVQFDGSATGAGQSTTWYWTFGDGTTGSGEDPLHLYSETGEYEVCLYAISIYPNSAGGPLTCIDTTCAVVFVQNGGDPCDGLSADFWFGTNGGNPTSIFYSATIGTGPHWLWNFGDGTYSDNGPQGTHTYTAAGTYTMCLTVWDWIPGTQDTCSVTTCQNITIEGGDPCTDLEACFVASQTSANTVFFNNCTQPGINTQYLWSFGDGSDGSGVSPTHTYDQSGTYTVCLTAYWNDCVDEFCSTVVVQGGTDPCDGLEAGFTYSTSASGTQFSNATTGTGISTNWYWTFGDNTISTDAQPFHTYAEPGTYEVCLYAISVYVTGSGAEITCVDTTCAPVVIGGGGPCDDLNACFDVAAVDNDSFIFENCSTPSTNVQYVWNFGDGSVGSGVNAEHNYQASGTYVVCLTAYWANCVDSTCTTVTVTGTITPCDELEAGFTWTTTPNGTQFSNGTTGTGQSTTWHWVFGDGTTSNDAQPFHTYPEPGVYVTCLYAISIFETGSGPLTCVDTTCADVIIQGNDPCDDLSACFEVVAIDSDSFSFSNCTQPGTNIQYLWHFGDGSTGTGVNPDHSYAEPGTYTVCLAAYWGNCVDEYCTTITVQGGSNTCDDLAVAFTWNTTPNGTQFTSTTVGAGVQTTWTWTFGDGATGNGPQPFHTYAEPGNYLVCVLVTTFYEVNGELVACAEDYCDELEIGGGGPCNDLNACFEVVAVDNNSFYFENCSTPSTNIQYVWNFGDGTTESGVNVDHSYLEPGTYVVCLTAYWENCVDSTCTTVVVEEAGGCTPFQIDFGYGIQNNAVVFEATASVPVVGYLWYFGDGGEGYGQTVTHLYELPGPFNVCLAAWYWNNNTQDTCWAEHCEWVDPFDVGVTEENMGNVLIYPVPAHGGFTINGLASPCDLQLYSPEGRLVIQQRITTQRHLVDVGSLAPAVYLLELRSRGGNTWRRIVIE